MAVHRIIYRPEFDDDAERLGGIAAVQKVLVSLILGLERAPDRYGLLDVAKGVRYVALRAVEGMPRLVVTFIIDEDEDVIMTSVDAR